MPSEKRRIGRTPLVTIQSPQLPQDMVVVTVENERSLKECRGAVEQLPACSHAVNEEFQIQLCRLPELAKERRKGRNQGEGQVRLSTPAHVINLTNQRDCGLLI